MKISELKSAIEVGLAASGIEGARSQEISNTILVAIKMRESMASAAPAPAEMDLPETKIPVHPDLRPAEIASPPPGAAPAPLVVLASESDLPKDALQVDAPPAAADSKVIRATEGLIVNRVVRDGRPRHGKLSADEFQRVLMGMPEVISIRGLGSQYDRTLQRSIQQTNYQQLIRGELKDFVMFQVVYYLSDQNEDLAVRLRFTPDEDCYFDRPNLDALVKEAKEQGSHNYRKRERIIVAEPPRGPSMMDHRSWVSVSLSETAK